MDAAQAFLNATAAVQLATLPLFSNNLKEDKFTPAQWLQKVNSHKTAAVEQAARQHEAEVEAAAVAAAKEAAHAKLEVLGLTAEEIAALSK